jgi:hypothetical protein
MDAWLRRTLHGAVAGVIGAACMTALRMLAQRAKWIDQMVPQAVEAKAKHELPIMPSGVLSALPSQRALHHIADQLMHLGYGSGWGAVYGLALGEGRASLKKVLSYGLGVWGVGSFVLLPALKILRPEWRARPAEIAVNLGAHLLYAGTVALLTEELEAQSFVQPLQYPASLVAKTG